VFDIYHVQIMDGDVIRRLRRHIGVIAHIHTAGVPGRAELDAAHEFIPMWDDKLVALRHSVRVCVCDV
jgi:hydroxypyruvate isomerase